MPRTMVWRECLGNKDVDSRQLAVVQWSSLSWTLSQLENPENGVWENSNVKLDKLDKMVAMECTGCTGNLGNKIRKKMGKWIGYDFPPNLPKADCPHHQCIVIVLVSEQSSKVWRSSVIDSNVHYFDVTEPGCSLTCTNGLYKWWNHWMYYRYIFSGGKLLPEAENRKPGGGGENKCSLNCGLVLFPTKVKEQENLKSTLSVDFRVHDVHFVCLRARAIFRNHVQST